MNEIKNNCNQDSMDKNPLVSICLFVYNQERFFRQAIESLLMQRTSFSYEIIVHDDASTDYTKALIEEYVLNFPHIIKPIFQEQNKYSLYGMSYLIKLVTSKANGEYIALCAGDDYWIDPQKIQKQVDFLDSNPDYGLVHTKAAKFSEDRGVFEGTHGARVDSLEDLLTECSIAALTVCLRSSLVKQYFNEIKPEEHKTWTTEDFPMWVWFMKHSKFKFFEDYTAVYRSYLGSISHVEDDSKRLQFSEGVYDIVDYYLKKYNDVNKPEIIKARYYSNMISMFFLNKRWDGIRTSVKVFYDADDWLNILWIGITLPLFYSRFMIKASYRARSMVFNLFNIYPIRK